MTHVVWTCGAAQRVWRLVHAQWSRRLRTKHPVYTLQNSVGPETPVLARDIRDIERSSPTDPWLLTWWAATYLGDSNTNNAAEHTALATGLREAAERFSNERVTVDVVGDSMLAPRQLQNQIRANEPRFRGPIHTSRTALLELYDYRLSHTYRTGNKSADWLANWAMNNHSSTSSGTADASTARQIRQQLYITIQRDSEHPLTRPKPLNTVCTRILALQAELTSQRTQTPPKRPRPLVHLTTHDRPPRPKHPRTG